MCSPKKQRVKRIYYDDKEESKTWLLFNSCSCFLDQSIHAAMMTFKIYFRSKRKSNNFDYDMQCWRINLDWYLKWTKMNIWWLDSSFQFEVFWSIDINQSINQSINDSLDYSVLFQVKGKYFGQKELFAGRNLLGSDKVPLIRGTKKLFVRKASSGRFRLSRFWMIPSLIEFLWIWI